jgi:tetratricopeptide (TPR) repeat protein
MIDIQKMKISFSENKFEDIVTILKIDESIISSQLLNKEILATFSSSLINAGYYLTAIHVIDSILKNLSENEKELKIKLLLLQCEACIYGYNFFKGKNVFYSLEIFFKEKNGFENEKLLFLQYEILKSFFNLPSEANTESDCKISKYIEIMNEKPDYKSLSFCYLKMGLNDRVNHKFSDAIINFERSLFNYSKIEDKFGIANVHYQLGYSYLILDKLELAIENFNTSKEIFNELKLYNKFSGTLTFLGYAYMKNGDLKTAEMLLLESLTVKKIFENDYFENYSRENLGDLYFIRGDFDSSLHYYLKAKEGFEENKSIKLLSAVLNKLGTLNSAQGHFEASLSYHTSALKNFTNINDYMGIPWTKLYLGESKFEMGDFDGALSCFNESLSQFTSFNNIHGIGFVSLLIGRIYLILNNENAIEYYLNAKNIFTKMDYYEGLVEAYIGLGICYEEKNKDNEALELIKKAQDIVTIQKKGHQGIAEKIFKYGLYSIENTLGKGYSYIDFISSSLDQLDENKKNKQRKKFLKAIKLKNELRLREQSKALELFESIIKEEIIEYHTTILSYLFIFEIKIFELKAYNNTEFISEANEILEKIIKLTSSNDLSLWTAKILALKAEIKLIELNFNEAKKFLNEAMKIAVSKNMKRLAFQFSNKYDEMVNKIVQLQLVQSERLTIAERLEITDLSIFDSNRDKFNLEIPTEESSYISIISETGHTLYSFNFNNTPTEEFDQLISGFLVAINSVISKLFASTGFIERIKHNEYTITLFSLIESVYICYAYKGPSYHAQNKIEDFKKVIEGETISRLLIEASNKKKTLNQEEIDLIEKILFSIFSKRLII